MITERVNDNLKAVNLSKLESGKSAVIVEAPEHSLLAPLGFRAGKKVKVMCKQCCGGPIVTEIAGRTSAIDRKIAKKIKLVCEN